ncbi:MAG: phenylalanyl-tRNA synthetase beta chain [Solirubrobacteraceae bacterium]|nr:phenylalanyl-tRNA synthetase beta chain [Solirubrobacteraceae bacterium]
MRVPLLWLHDYTVPQVPLRELQERLTMTGTLVEGVTTHGVAALDHFVVAKVLTAERHPDADRLTVCTVDLGDGGEPSQIVCGAPNVGAGQTVAVAQPGSVMPDGTRLKAAKLRGQASNGMILAEDEVGIGTDHDGIMVLDEALAAGTPLADVLPITTDVLELEITPNRPDCLSIYGVAREVHAAVGSPLAPPPWVDDPGTAGDVAGFGVEVECPELCPRFTLRAFENVTLGPSPAWLKARLMAAGQRPIYNVVDITNYVMLLTGQPIHAFVADRVEGGRLVVRRAREGEKLVTLDDVERTLDAEMVVIDDAAGPTSIAGVMGGNRSEVHDGTTRVLIEAATWDGPNIQRTSTQLALRTEASGRFEKGLSAESGMEAQAVATRLMLELTGATLVPGTIDVDARGTVAPRVLHLREARVGRLIGRDVARPEQARILESLGFAVADAGDGLDVTVPHFRLGDVTREVDLVEEVARIDGFETLPDTLPSRKGAVGILAPEQRLRRRAEDALVGAGLYEVVGWSFTSTAAQQRLGTSVEPVRLKNPMSEEQAVMRTHVLTSLLASVETNARRGTPDVRLFEIGSVYLPWDPDRPRPPGRWDPPAGTPGAAAWAEGALPDERTHVAALISGSLRTPSWDDDAPPAANFFGIKGVLEALARALRVEVSVEPASEPFLHPGRSARVLAGGDPAGWIGELHPSLGAGAAFELDLSVLIAAADAVPIYRDLTSFPSLRQDLAVTLGDDVPAAAVVAVVEKAGGKLLAGAEVFDVYRGEQVGEGRHSLALRLTFRAPDRTLTDEDVEPARSKIVARLREELGGELRG